MKRLYVGNLPFSATQDDVRNEFAKYGAVEDCKLITDRESGQPRGFGFVTFTNNADADQAIQALHGQNFGGRNLTVNEAEDRKQGGGGGGFRGGNGGGGGGGGGDRKQGGGGGGGGRSGGGGGGGGGRGGRGRQYEE